MLTPQEEEEFESKYLTVIKYRLGGDEKIAFSVFDPTFPYQLGDLVEVKQFDTDPRTSCTNGIHCFFTQNEVLEFGLGGKSSITNDLILDRLALEELAEKSIY